MNNAINEIKNTLEATNSRITEAEGLNPKLGFKNIRELLIPGNINGHELIQKPPYLH